MIYLFRLIRIILYNYNHIKKNKMILKNFFFKKRFLKKIDLIYFIFFIISFFEKICFKHLYMIL